MGSKPIIKALIDQFDYGGVFFGLIRIVATHAR